MLSAYLGDITLATTDTIVNAANPGLLGGGGVDGAIHRAAGPELLAFCKAIKMINGVRCPYGEARITRAGNLTCQYVVHAVGPIYHNESNPAQVLFNVYNHSLRLVKQHDCQSVTFPAISCGVYGYPHKEAAEVAIKACRQAEFNKIHIAFALFSPELLSIWQEAIKTS